MKVLSLLPVLFLWAAMASAQFSIQQYKYLKNPRESVVSADGKFLYASHSKGLTVFSIHPSTKELSTLQSINLEAGCQSALLSPNEQYVLACSFGEDAILVYKRAADGQLSLYKSHKRTIDGVTIEEPSDLVMSPSGNYIFFDVDRTLFTFRFNRGDLEYVTEHTLTGSYHGKVYFSPDNKHVFINNYNSTAGGCSLPILTLDEETGLLEPVGCIEEKEYLIPNSYWEIWGERRQHNVRAIFDYMSFSPDGKDVYMAGYYSGEGSSSAIIHYRWIDGQLRVKNAYYDLDKKYKINSTKDMFMDGNGDYLYLMIGGNDSGVFIFKRDKGKGGLSFVRAFYKLENLPKIVSPYKISFTPDNKAAFISNYFGGNIMVLKNKVGQPGPQKKPVLPPAPPAPVVDYTDNNYSGHDNAYNSNPSNNSGNTPSNCEFPRITTAELAQLEQQLAPLSTDQARYDAALKQLQNKCLQTVEVMRIARLLEVEYLRLEFIKFAYYYTADLENYYLLDSVLTSTRLKESFRKYLEG